MPEKVENSEMTNSKTSRILIADARHLRGRIAEKSIDLIFTSPPYWQCRDYGHRQQIGQEETPEKYVENLIAALNSWKPLLRPQGSIVINIGDVYRNNALVGIPAMFEIAVRQHGWLIANRIIWAKERGIPEPNPNRLASRHEFIFHIVTHKQFYFDLHALETYLGRTSNPGDVWQIEQARSSSNHLAPFPPELARRVILVACPERVCPQCGKPHTRRLRPTMQLDMNRKQAQRALQIYRNSNLTQEHIAAIRAVGISDAGKGQLIQNGANKNAARTTKLANEAKKVLGGYFREFTFAPKRQVGWNKCNCKVAPQPGTVLDPFMGSGTTLRVARELERKTIGVDLKPLRDS
jgi:DNA modification methylase